MEALLETDFFVVTGDLAPDGRWMAYESDASDDWEVYVRPFPDVDSGGRWQVSSGGGESPLWGPDGREIFYWPRAGDLMRVAIETDPGFRQGTPERLLERGQYRLDSRRRKFDIAPDGQRFLLLKDNASGTEDDPYAGLTQFIVVQNWHQELERLVRRAIDPLLSTSSSSDPHPPARSLPSARPLLE